MLRHFFYPPSLWAVGFFLGFSYLILPGYLYLIILVSGGIILIGAIKSEYAYFLVILTLIVEMVHLFVSVTYFGTTKYFPFQYFLVVAAIGWMIARTTGRPPERKATPLDGILLAIVFYEIVTILWAPNLLFSLTTSVFLLLNFLLFFISGAIITDSKMLKKAVNVWIIAGIVAATGIILSQWIEVRHIADFTNTIGIQLAFQQLGQRPSGLGGCDHAAGFTNTAIIMTLGVLAIEEKLKRKVLYLFLILYMLCGVITTKSRGALFGLIGASLFFIYMHPYFKGKLIKYSFVIGITILALLFIVQPGMIDRTLIGLGYEGKLFFSKYEYHIAQEDPKAGLSGFDIRSYWWKNALNAMIEKPLKLFFGLGIGSFTYYSTRYPGEEQSPEVNNLYFAFLYDMGMIGVIMLFIFLPILVSNLYYYLKNSKKTYAYYIFLASVAAFIADPGIHGLVDYDLTFIGSKFFWFPLGFMMAAMNIVRTEMAKDKNK